MDANIVELERLRKLGLVLTSSEAVDQLEEIGMSGQRSGPSEASFFPDKGWIGWRCIEGDEWNEVPGLYHLTEVSFWRLRDKGEEPPVCSRCGDKLPCCGL